MKNLIFFGMLTFLVSCQSESPYSREMKSIESLIQAVDTAIAQTARIDTSRMHQDIASQRDNITRVAMHYRDQKDTIGHEIAMLLVEYNRSAQTTESLLVRYRNVRADLHYTKAQLENLHHDLSHNLLDDQTVKEVHQEEREATERIFAEARELNEAMIQPLSTDSITGQRMDSVVNSLETR